MSEHNDRTKQDLKAFSLLGNLADEQLSGLVALLHEKTFPAGTEILREGEEGNEMFLLLDGEVDVLNRTPYGEEYVTASLSGADHCTFGEMALIDSGRRSATVCARSDCRVLGLTHEDFQRLCKEDPRTGLELLKAVSLTLVHNLRKENDNLRLVYQALIEEIENG